MAGNLIGRICSQKQRICNSESEFVNRFSMVNIIPMAGVGNRFLEELYRVPKPFVPVMNNPMFITAIRSFPSADRYILVCRRNIFERLKSITEGVLPQSEIIVIDKVTEGQACTCLLAEDRLNPEEGLFTASCDYQMVYDHERYEQLLADEKLDVIVWTFKIGAIKKADPCAFAYCRTEGDRVTEVVEKKVISDTPHLDPAVVGSFTYKRAELFLYGAKKMIGKNIRVNNEFYVGTSINQLIEEGCRVVTFEIEKFISFGNPFELMLFNYWQEYFDQLESHPYTIDYGFKKIPY